MPISSYVLTETVSLSKLHLTSELVCFAIVWWFLRRPKEKRAYRRYTEGTNFTFDVHVTVYRDKFLIIKKKMTNFSNLFWKETLHVSDSSSVHHKEFFTVHTAMVYVIKVFLSACKQDQDVPSRSCLQAVRKTCMAYTIVVCTVKNSWWWTEELSETCRVSFQNKSGKLVHLVGFIIRNLSRCTVTWTSEISHSPFRAL